MWHYGTRKAKEGLGKKVTFYSCFEIWYVMEIIQEISDQTILRVAETA